MTCVRWDDKGQPHSVAFNDKYFCTQNGYEEALHVSCQGNRLPERFAGLDPARAGTFTIIETGFGTGLSFCCAWQLWERHAPSSWRLHFISVELYPLLSQDLRRALDLWPALSVYKNALLAEYTSVPAGIKDFYFNGRRICLRLVIEDVVTALAQIKNNALAPECTDAWFLNGFAPFKNPRMWSAEVFAGMAPLSRQGTTFSTFTVAGFVRRGLQSQGFDVQRVTGYGKKKQILTGTFRP